MKRMVLRATAQGDEYNHLYADSWAQNIWVEMLS